NLLRPVSRSEASSFCAEQVRRRPPAHESAVHRRVCKRAQIDHSAGPNHTLKGNRNWLQAFCGRGRSSPHAGEPSLGPIRLRGRAKRAKQKEQLKRASKRAPYWLSLRRARKQGPIGRRGTGEEEFVARASLRQRGG